MVARFFILAFYDTIYKYIELIASFMSYSFETFDEYFNLTNPSVDSFKILIRDFNEVLDEKHRESSE